SSREPDRGNPAPTDRPHANGCDHDSHFTPIRIAYEPTHAANGRFSAVSGHRQRHPPRPADCTPHPRPARRAHALRTAPTACASRLQPAHRAHSLRIAPTVCAPSLQHAHGAYSLSITIDRSRLFSE